MTSVFRDALCVLDHWQTLAAGLLALVAGGITVFGTLAAANRQVKAANESADHQIKAAAAAADRQVAAAQEQTQAAQRQTAVMREIERRRIAREAYAFHSMLEAAMSVVIEDVATARNLPPPSPGSEAYSVQAYAVRQSVRRTGFNELRNAFLRFGGTLTTQNFLQLDKEIEDFARQWLPAPPGNPALYSMVRPPIGVNAGLQEQLDRIESQAIALREEATIGMRLCRDELAKEAINLES